MVETGRGAAGVPAAMPPGFRADFVSQVLAATSQEPAGRMTRGVAGASYARALASVIRRLPAGARISRSA